jgi:hypothetical protein
MLRLSQDSRPVRCTCSRPDRFHPPNRGSTETSDTPLLGFSSLRRIKTRSPQTPGIPFPGFGAAHADSHGFSDLLLLRPSQGVTPITTLGFGGLQGFSPLRIGHRLRLPSLLLLNPPAQGQTHSQLQGFDPRSDPSPPAIAGARSLLDLPLLQGIRTSPAVRRRNRPKTKPSEDATPATFPNTAAAKPSSRSIPPPTASSVLGVTPGEVLEQPFSRPTLMEFLPCHQFPKYLINAFKEA